MKSIFATIALVVVAMATAAALHSKFDPLYEHQSRHGKMNQLWENILKYDSASGPWPGVVAKLKIIFGDLSASVNDETDIHSGKCPKLIHSVGAVAKCSFEFGESSYTGLFKGADTALVRLSMAVEPTKKSFVPGSAFKLLRDGVTSGNFVAMNSLNGQTGFNFFQKDFSNHISSQNLHFQQKLLKRNFQKVSLWATYVGLSHMAQYDQDSNETPENEMLFPFQIILKPNPDLHFPDIQGGDPLVDQLATIPIGTVLYTIMAAPAPKTAFTKIGVIRTKGKFTKSSYGDENLFFQHQKFEDDLALNSKQNEVDQSISRWLNVCPKVDSCLVCPFDEACPNVTHNLRQVANVA